MVRTRENFIGPITVLSDGYSGPVTSFGDVVIDGYSLQFNSAGSMPATGNIKIAHGDSFIIKQQQTGPVTDIDIFNYGSSGIITIGTVPYTSSIVFNTGGGFNINDSYPTPSVLHLSSKQSYFANGFSINDFDPSKGVITTDDATPPANSRGIDVVSGSGQDSGSINIGTGLAGDTSGSISILTGFAFGPSGHVNIQTQESTNASSGNIFLETQNGKTGSGNISIATNTATTSGSSGGISATTGNSPGTTGTLVFTCGASSASSGGYIVLRSGEGYINGGFCDLFSGNGTTGIGGPINIQTGTGPIYDGYITFTRGSYEVARFDDYNGSRFLVDGYTKINNDLAVTGTIYANGIPIPPSNPDDNNKVAYASSGKFAYATGFHYFDDGYVRINNVASYTSWYARFGNTSQSYFGLEFGPDVGSPVITQVMNTAGAANSLSISAQASNAGNGGGIGIHGGNSTETGAGNGGTVTISGGSSVDGNGGYVYLQPGSSTNAGWGNVQVFGQSGVIMTFGAGNGTNISALVLDMGGNIIQNMDDPASASDAATKNYVDNPFVLTPSVISSSQNDYGPTDWLNAYVVRLQAVADGYNITGFVADPAKLLRKIINVGTHSFVIKNQSGSSVSTNRVTIAGGDLTVAANASANLFYDATDSIWRVA